MAYTFSLEKAIEANWDERCARLEREVDNMTADDLYNYAIDANDDELCSLVFEITTAAIDRDWPSVESHTKALVEAIKNHIPFSAAR